MADILHLQMLSKTIFYRLQKKYKEYRSKLLNQYSDIPVQLAGDGHCDSPGHNDMYCTYSVMDQNSSQIIHFYVISVAETQI